jgi:hypothetical protein
MAWLSCISFHCFFFDSVSFGVLVLLALHTLTVLLAYFVRICRSHAMRKVFWIRVSRANPPLCLQ